MYLIELVVKKILALTKPKDIEDLPSEIYYDDNKDYETCEHIFMPIDSTNEVLACAKCGFVVKRSELKKKNFFES